jgi:hypothetical protein
VIRLTNNVVGHEGTGQCGTICQGGVARAMAAGMRR